MTFVAYGNFTFQSTHPGWGATFGKDSADRKDYVSIHAPRVGCDP